MIPTKPDAFSDFQGDRVFLSPLIITWAGIMMILPLVLLAGLGDAKLIAVSSPPGIERLVHLTLNTMMMSGFAGILATGFSLVCVLLIQKMNPAWRPFVVGLAILPVFVSPPIMAIVAVRLLGPSGWFSDFLTTTEMTFPVVERVRSDTPNLPSAPIYTLWGGGFTLAWALYPFSLLLLQRALSLLPRDQIDAARLESGYVGVLLRVVLPQLLPALGVSAALVTFLAMIEFGIPEALRSLPVLVSEVYVQAGVFYDLRNATLAGLLLVGVAALILIPVICLMDSVVEGEPESVTEKNENTFLKNSLSTSIVSFPALAILMVLLLTATGPNGPLEVWSTAIRTGHEEILKSVIMGLVSVPMIVIPGFFLGISLFRSRARWLARVLILAPFLTPSPLLALSFSQVLRFPDRYEIPILDDIFHGFSQTHGPLLMVWILRFAPLVALIVDAILRYSLSRETRMLTMLEGGSRFRKVLGVYLPLSKPALFISAILVSGLSLSEVGAAVLLMPPGITNLGVRLLTQMHYAPTGQISALAFLMVVPGLIFTITIGFIWKKLLPG